MLCYIQIQKYKQNIIKPLQYQAKHCQEIIHLFTLFNIKCCTENFVKV